MKLHLEKKLVVKDSLKKDFIHNNQFRQRQYEQNQLSENSSDSLAPKKFRGKINH